MTPCAAIDEILDVITGLVPVIPTREAPRFSTSGWPAQGRP
jgi:hypothetical protein